MTFIKHLVLPILILPLLVVAIPTSTADACTPDPVSSISTPLVLPADGQSAPPNTKVWITAPIDDYYFYDRSPLDYSDIELRSEDMAIEVSAKAVSARAVFVNHLWIIEPVKLLDDGQVVEVWIRGEKVSNFVVRGSELSIPPSPPTLESVDVVGEEFGLLFCGESSQISVSVREPTTLLFLSEQSPGNELPSSVLAIGTEQIVTAMEVDVGDRRLQVFAVDLAGNLSEPTPLPELTVPPTVTGCSASDAQQSPPFWILALFLALVAHRPKRARSAAREKGRWAGPVTD
ncbi:MAG: hypothetical protein JKY56_23280 [Kofleriaceae bacterium]|nr:hypothetical protein [Kofleriaceae bacterium]